MSAYATIKDFTLVDRERCYELWDLAKQSININGVILKVGVWRGGTGCLLAMAAPTKLVYLSDTFDGVVKARANVLTIEVVNMPIRPNRSSAAFSPQLE